MASTSMEEGDVPVRGRGGFKHSDLRTVPANITQTRTTLTPAHQQVNLFCNYVPINAEPNRQLQMYRVDFEPQVESVKLMGSLFRWASNKVFKKKPLYDGVHECRSVEKLPDKVTTVEVAENNAPEPKMYKVTIAHTGVTAMGNEMIRTYNIHMKEFFRLLGYYQPQPGLNVHPQQSSSVGNLNIKILRGFRTAANLHDEGRLLMNFEGAHKLFQERNVCEELMEFYRSGRDNWQAAAEQALSGKLVLTNYNHRAYRIESIDYKSTPKSTFFYSKMNREITYLEFYKTVHNTVIKDEKQPLLDVVPNNIRRRGDEERDKVTKLVPELCNIAGLTDQQRNDGRLKMDLIRATQVRPSDRLKQLRDFLQILNSNTEVQSSLSTWGYSYEREPLKLKGYVIPQTAIGSGPVVSQPIAQWPRAKVESADFFINQLAAVPEIPRLVVIFPRGELGNKASIMGTLKSGFDSIRLQVGKVDTLECEGDNANHYINVIRRLQPPVTCAIIVLSRQNKTIYDAIKKLACADLGMVTQVVTSRLILDPKKGRSASTKIAIQVAAKVGGEPWYADIPLKGTMVCGYDTYHDTANRGRSFGAFLASLNDRYSKWFSVADKHDKLDEMSSQVSVNMLSALDTWKQNNGNNLPERVIIYRDGVGEGQIEHVYEKELKGIREKLEAVGRAAGKKMRLTLIIVNKRIGARFYMQQSDGQVVNPLPGTVIDHGPTRDGRYDFYLISQSTKQGTISPTYYNIIHDESGFTPEIHQKMALKFCFLYYNWAGSVRVPAPCQYAHKLALLCGEHIHDQPNANLATRLHFL